MFFPIQWEWVDKLIAFLQLAEGQLQSTKAAVITTLLLGTGVTLSYIKPFQIILCYINGCRKPNQEEKDLLRRLLSKSTVHSGKSVDSYNLYVSNDKNLNAFAIGTDNICVNRLMFRAMPEEELAGVLAHELGHIENRDTTYSLGCYGMNVIAELIINLYLISVRILSFFSFIPIFSLFIFAFIIFVRLQMFVIQFLLYLPLQLVSFFGSRQQEYAADLYACKVGLGRDLYNALQRIAKIYEEEPRGIFSQLWDTHPATEKRLRRIEAYYNS